MSVSCWLNVGELVIILYCELWWIMSLLLMYLKIVELLFMLEIERCKVVVFLFGSEGVMMVNGGLVIVVMVFFMVV